MAGTRNNANLANQPTFFEILCTRVRGRGYFRKRSIGWQGWRNGNKQMPCSLYVIRSDLEVQRQLEQKARAGLHI